MQHIFYCSLNFSFEEHLIFINFLPTNCLDFDMDHQKIELLFLWNLLHFFVNFPYMTNWLLWTFLHSMQSLFLLFLSVGRTWFSFVSGTKEKRKIPDWFFRNDPEYTRKLFYLYNFCRWYISASRHQYSYKF